MILKTDLETASQLLTSIEADFEKGTWTFNGPIALVGGGDYLVISIRDWQEVWRKYDEASEPFRPGGYLKDRGQ